MAKRKRKKTSKKQTFEIRKEVYAVLFILISIIGLGKLGPVGRLIASLSLFISGTAYMVTLVILLIIGLYTFFKGEWPEFFSTKFFGFYLLVIGILTFMHWDFITLNQSQASVVFRETINELTKGFNSLYETGTVNDSITVGGGIIGGVFALLFSKLFSIIGMKIISVAFVVVGTCLFTGFSISEFIKERLSTVKEKREQKEKDDGKEYDPSEENHLFKKKVKISNGNEME